MNDAIQQTLSQYIAVNILKQSGRTIRAEEALISDGLIDSFSLVDLALFVEEAFQVHIEDTELNAETFDTLAQLAELIATRQGRSNPGL
jgi:acyl carrier protein